MRAIAHWDADRFFASIEQAADRRLRARPVAVGAPGRGLVLSASPEARRFGVYPGMPTRRARRACPALTLVPAHFDLYEQFFHQILGLCQETTPLVEPVAVGAAYLDLTGTGPLHHAPPAVVVERLRHTVAGWLHVTLSAGIAANKTVARIAARLNKPCGQGVVPPGEEAAFLAPLPVQWLGALSRDQAATLEVAGVRTLGAFARAPLDALSLALGARALPLQRLAQGVDETPVRPAAVRDPAWRESVDFAGDVWEEPVLLAALRRMLETLMARARAARIEVRALTLQVRYTDREECERTLTLPQPTAVEDGVLPLLGGLLKSAWQRRVRLRGLALRASRFYQPSPQLSLFPETDRPGGSAHRLAMAIDAVRRTFGRAAVVRGYELRRPA